MNTVKNMLLMAMGSAATLAYQKYNKPVKKKMKQIFSNALNETDEMLDKMM